MDTALLVVDGLVAACFVAAWRFFRRYQLNRPPLGTFNRTDIVVMLCALVTVPYLYLVLPAWVAGGFLGLGVASILSVALRPVFPHRWTARVAVATLVAADVGLAAGPGASSALFVAVNNAVLLLAVVGTATLWAQGGMKARHLALLAAGVTVYDLVATTQASVMADIAQRLSAIPFVPFVSWGPPGDGLGVGLGDLLVGAVFPLVMRKAYGRTAGRLALGSAVVSVVGLLTAVRLTATTALVPAMVVLGPLIVAQVAYWQRRCGAERATWQYLRHDPLPAAAGTPIG